MIDAVAALGADDVAGAWCRTDEDADIGHEIQIDRAEVLGREPSGEMFLRVAHVTQLPSRQPAHCSLG